MAVTVALFYQLVPLTFQQYSDFSSLILINRSYHMVIKVAGGHDGASFVDKLEHCFAPSDDGNLGPLPLEGVVDDHVDAQVVEVGGETPGQLGQWPGLNFWNHLECSSGMNYARESFEPTRVTESWNEATWSSFVSPAITSSSGRPNILRKIRNYLKVTITCPTSGSSPPSWGG